MTNDEPDFSDPDFDLSDEQQKELLRSVARSVAWEKAMFARGVKVLALGLTPEQQDEAIAAWERESDADGNAHSR